MASDEVIKAFAELQDKLSMSVAFSQAVRLLKFLCDDQRVAQLSTAHTQDTMRARQCCELYLLSCLCIRRYNSNYSGPR